MQKLSFPFSPSTTSILPSLLHSLHPFSSSSSAADAGDVLPSDVEKLYRTLRKFHSSPSKLSVALHSLSIPLHPSLLDAVLLRAGAAPSLSLPFLFFALRQPHFLPSPSTHRHLLSLLARSRHFGAAWSLLDQLRRHSPHLISPDLFVALIRRFASSRLTSKAIQVLDEMPHYGITPDDYVFNCLLDALAKNGAVKEAAKLFDEMTDKFPPNLKQFTSLLYGWCKAGKMDEAKFVLVRMKDAGFDPDVVVYNTLLSGFCSVGKIEDARELLNEMRRRECEPNAISYTTLMQALCVRDRMDEAMRVFVEMRRNGCEADVVTYSTIIGGFARSGKIERAFEMLDGMVRSGCRPNPGAYFHIFVALEKKEDLEQCLELMGRMTRDHRCLPDLSIYNTVIRLACKVGESERAVEIWNEMEASRLSPSLDTFVIMVHGLLGQGSLLEACDYFREMVGRGLLSVPQYGILKDLLNSLLRAEKLELAKDLWGLIVSKGGELNVCAWTIWIHALFANGHVKEACCYCLDMMEAGLMPQPDTFAKLMKGLKKLYNRAIAAEITDKVRAMAEERNVSFKMYKRRGVMDLEKKMKKKREGRKEKGRKGRLGGGTGRGRGSPLSAFTEEEEDSIP